VPSTVDLAFGTVSAVSSRSTFRVRMATARTGDDPSATLWVVGELDYRARRDVAWTAGGIADVTVVTPDGRQISSQSLDVSASDISFTITPPEKLKPGEYAVRVRLRPNNEGALPVTDTMRLVVPRNQDVMGEGLLYRRGMSTGPKYVMTADARFLHSDRIRVELPTQSSGTATARMLDRQGKPNLIPVQVSDRQDADTSVRWIVVDASLAALAPGDYAIETSLDGVKQVTAFQLVP